MQFWHPLIWTPHEWSRGFGGPPQSDQSESSQVSTLTSTSTSCPQPPPEGSVATLKSVAAVKSIIFTAAVEANIVEWIKHHPELYDKLTACKDAASKGCFWTEKSVESNTKCKLLQTWYSSSGPGSVSSPS